MSFKCGFCKKTAPNGTKMRMVPSDIRQKEEGNRGGNYGTEIVAEKKCCESCWKDGVGIQPMLHLTPSKSPLELLNFTKSNWSE